MAYKKGGGGVRGGETYRKAEGRERRAFLSDFSDANDSKTFDAHVKKPKTDAPLSEHPFFLRNISKVLMILPFRRYIRKIDSKLFRHRQLEGCWCRHSVTCEAIS